MREQKLQSTESINEMTGMDGNQHTINRIQESEDLNYTHNIIKGESQIRLQISGRRNVHKSIDQNLNKIKGVIRIKNHKTSIDFNKQTLDPQELKDDQIKRRKFKFVGESLSPFVPKYQDSYNYQSQKTPTEVLSQPNKSNIQTIQAQTNNQQRVEFGTGISKNLKLLFQKKYQNKDQQNSQNNDKQSIQDKNKLKELKQNKNDKMVQQWYQKSFYEARNNYNENVSQKKHEKMSQITKNLKDNVDQYDNCKSNETTILNSDMNQRYYNQYNDLNKLNMWYEGSCQNEEYIDRNALNYQRRKKIQKKRSESNLIIENDNQEYTQSNYQVIIEAPPKTPHYQFYLQKRTQLLSVEQQIRGLTPSINNRNVQLNQNNIFSTMKKFSKKISNNHVNINLKLDKKSTILNNSEKQQFFQNNIKDNQFEELKQSSVSHLMNNFKYQQKIGEDKIQISENFELSQNLDKNQFIEKQNQNQYFEKSQNHYNADKMDFGNDLQMNKDKQNLSFQTFGNQNEIVNINSIFQNRLNETNNNYQEWLKQIGQQNLKSTYQSQHSRIGARLLQNKFKKTLNTFWEKNQERNEQLAVIEQKQKIQEIQKQEKIKKERKKDESQNSIVNGEDSDLIMSQEDLQKLQEEIQLKQLQQELTIQRNERLLAAKKALEEERKQFLILGDLHHVINIVDNQINCTNQYLKSVLNHDFNHSLKPYFSSEQERSSFFQIVQMYCWSQYFNRLIRKAKYSKCSQDCIIQKAIKKKKDEIFNLQQAQKEKQKLSYSKPKDQKKQKNQKAQINMKSPSVQFNLQNKEESKKEFLVDVCCHTEIREHQLLKYYQIFRDQYIFQKKQKNKKLPKITREQCIENAVRDASTSEERIIRNKESFLHQKLKKKNKELLSSDDSDSIMNEDIETWKEPETIKQIIISPNQQELQSNLMNCTNSYKNNSVFAQNFNNQLYKMQINIQNKKEQQQIVDKKKFKSTLWNDIISKKLYEKNCVLENTTNKKIEEEQQYMSTLQDKQLKEFLNQKKLEVEEFQQKMQNFIIRFKTGKYIDEDNYTSRSPTPASPSPNLSPSTISRMSNNFQIQPQKNIPAKKRKPPVRQQTSLLQLMKSIVKIMHYEISVNEKQNILNSFFQHIKKDCQKGYVEETNQIYQLYQDYFIENYYKHGNTVLPSFSLIKDQTLLIYQYQLSKGQARGLASVLQKYREYFQSIVGQIDINNCSLKDEDFAEILKGVKDFENIYNISYSNDEMKELATEQLIDIINKKSGNVNMMSLNLIHVNTNSACLLKIFQNLQTNESLKKLRVRDINLNNQLVFQNLNSALIKLHTLTHLDLSSTNLSNSQILELSIFLQTNIQIENLNISYNYMKRNNKKNIELIKNFIANMVEFIENNNQIIHLKMEGMNLQEDTIVLIDAIKNKSISLYSVHFGDNQIEIITQKQIYQAFDLENDFKCFHLSDPQQISIASEKNSQKFRETYKMLLQLDQKSGCENQIERNKCILINCYHLKQVYLDKFKQQNFESHMHQAYQNSKSIQVSQPLTFTREFQFKELKLFQIVKENLQDFPEFQRWSAKRNNSCYVCERHAYIQIYYKPERSQKEYTKIEDPKIVEYLKKVYGLKNSNIKTPQIFGSLVQDMNSGELQSYPMIFMSHFAFNFILPQDYLQDTKSELRKQFIQIIKDGCLYRKDQLEFTQNYIPHNFAGRMIDQFDSLKIQHQRFDPVEILRIHKQGFFKHKSNTQKLLDYIMKIPESEDVQQFNFPSQDENQKPKSESQISNERASKQYMNEDQLIKNISETFIYACLASPGVHLVLIYDPLLDSIFKKVISVQQKDKNRDFVSKQLQNNKNYRDDKNEINIDNQISHKIVCLKDLQEESKFAFKIDIQQQNFHENLQMNQENEQKQLIDCLQIIYKNYNVICCTYNYIMMQQADKKIQKHEEKSPIEVSDKILSSGITYNKNLWDSIFSQILNDSISEDQFQSVFFGVSKQTLTKQSKFSYKLLKRNDFTSFLIKLALTQKNHSQFLNDSIIKFEQLLEKSDLSPINILPDEDPYCKIIASVMSQNFNNLHQKYMSLQHSDLENNKMEPRFTIKSAFKMLFNKNVSESGKLSKRESIIFFNQSKHIPVIHEDILTDQYQCLEFQEFMCLVALVLRHYSAVDLNNKEDKKKFISDQPSVIDPILKAIKTDPFTELKVQSILDQLFDIK